MNAQTKKYLKITGIMFLIMIVSIFSSTTLYYFNIISSFLNTLISFISILTSFIIGGYMYSKKAKEKGYLQGIKISIGILFIIILFNIIFNNTIFHMSYLIFILFAACGGMIGINSENDE